MNPEMGVVRIRSKDKTLSLVGQGSKEVAGALTGKWTSDRISLSW